MTDFWQGFMTATALYAVSIIALSTWLYVRGERRRQRFIDQVVAKVATGTVSVNEARAVDIPQELDFIVNPQGKKGIH